MYIYICIYFFYYTNLKYESMLKRVRLKNSTFTFLRYIPSLKIEKRALLCTLFCFSFLILFNLSIHLKRCAPSFSAKPHFLIPLYDIKWL